MVARLKKNGHPSPAPAREPFCTRSQILEYFDTAGTKLAIVHRYLRPDGRIGASGRPDPKVFLDGDTLYVLVPDLDTDLARR